MPFKINDIVSRFSVTLTCCWQRFHLKGQSNVALVTYFQKYDWLQKPSLPFFNQSWRGCSHFSRAWQRLRVLVRILIGLFRPDFVIGQSLLGKLTGLTTHLYLYRLHCWSRLGSYNRQHVYWLHGRTGQKTKSTQSTLFICWSSCYGFYSLLVPCARLSEVPVTFRPWNQIIQIKILAIKVQVSANLLKSLFWM